MRRLFRSVLLALSLALPHAAQAQQSAASLVADRIEIRADRILVADGNVEIFHQGRRLRATRVEYDRSAGQLTLAGPLVLSDPAGSNTILLADQAQLSDDLRDGILRGARVVLERQLQMAATEITRVGGRYTQLTRAVASSCQVCATTQTPLWEIRARRVIHDQLERQIHFEQAQLRFGGVPVMWFPRLRMPDPTLDRATGFLMPRLASTSALGTGLHIPYFIAIAPDRDLKLTPFIATKDVFSLGVRYRQAFRAGTISFEGAVSHDRLVAGRRGYLTTQGRFDLGQGFKLEFSGETISDDAYLRDYRISDKDRLDSRATITRTRPDRHFSARVAHFHSLRVGEVNATMPSLLADVIWMRRFDLPGIGGTGRITIGAHGHYRSSDADAIGRDMGRATIDIGWRRDWVLPAGVIAALDFGLAGDLHRVAQDVRWPSAVSTWTPSAALELRWPLLRTTGTGASETLEPIAQLVWSRLPRAGHVPNEDSVLVEFDEGNLFDFNRFSGVDRREGGTRLNFGVQWTRHTATGWSMGALAGRVVRLRDDGQFTAASGLGGRQSDWLAALHVAGPDGWRLMGRALFDNRFSASRAEMRLAVNRSRYGIGLAYLWDEADPAENRAASTSELVVDGRYALGRGWTAKADGRYDFSADRATRAGLGLEFANECLRVDVSLSRRFTSSTSVRPTTDFGLSVDLVGFGSNRAAGSTRQVCAR